MQSIENLEKFAKLAKSIKHLFFNIMKIYILILIHYKLFCSFLFILLYYNFKDNKFNI
jgi:hypothetical protein